MLGKHCLDAGFGQFFNILEQTCFKGGVFFQKVDAKKTSHMSPNYLNETGKKELSERVLSCYHCSYTTDRDGAGAQVILKRGLAAVGHRVKMHRTMVNSWESLGSKNPHIFLPESVKNRWFSRMCVGFDILTVLSSAVILDASSTGANEVVLPYLCAPKRVVAISHPDFIYVCCCILVSVVFCLTIQALNRPNF